jgi:hypothetical protein
MADLESRIQKAIEDITGNESLLEMLDADAADEMLEWGKSAVTSLVKQTEGLDDTAAELALDSRLKAVRQFMRSAGNWAAGKYTDPADRLQLREKLLDHAKVIYGGNAPLPSEAEMDAVLNRLDVQPDTQKQSVLNLKELFNEAI